MSSNAWTILFVALIAAAGFVGCATTPAPKVILDARGNPCPQPATKVNPVYPYTAINRKIDQGKISFTFDLKQGEGKPLNIQVLSSDPPGVFDATTIRAFREWKYVAPMDLERCTAEFEFKLK